MRKLKFTQCGVICHGLSELQIARYIKSNLHLKMETFSRDNGNSSIQITSVLDFLSSKNFTNIKKFAEDNGVEFEKKKLKNFKLFIIMDTDDCTSEQKKSFIDKSMFINHPLYEYIYPIFNCPDLEEVLVKAGIMVKKIKNEQKGSYYFKTFPINSEPFSMNSYNEIEDLMNKLKLVKNNNLNEFLKYCLDLVYQERK